MKLIRKQPRTTLAIALASLAMAAGSAQAALIAYDQFTGYTDGSLTSQGEGIGWGNNWSASASVTVSGGGNLSYDPLATAGGGANVGSTTNGSAYFQRDLQAPIADSGTYYFGFLMAETGDPTKAGFRIQDAGGNNNAGAGTWNGSSNYGIYSNEGGYLTPEGTALSGVAGNNGTNFFVIKLDFSTTTGVKEVASLYINPTQASLGGTADATKTFNIQWGSITRVQGNFVGASGQTTSMAFDEIRIGTEAADMFSAIPEPSTSLLVAFAATALLLRRRRD